MPGYNAKVNKKQNPDVLSVETGGSIDIETGGKILANGTQAAHIANATGAAGANPTQAEYAALVAKFNSVLLALEGAGVLASS